MKLWALSNERRRDYIACPSLEAAIACRSRGDQIVPWHWPTCPQWHADEAARFLELVRVKGRLQ